MERNEQRMQMRAIGFALCVFFACRRCFASLPADGETQRFALRAAASLLGVGLPALLLGGEGLPVPAFAPPQRRLRLAALPLGLVLFTVTAAASWLFREAFAGIGIIGSPAAVFPKEPCAQALFLLGNALLAPLAEELLFRGCILGRLRRFGERFALLVSAALFALAHGDVVRLAPTFLAGVLLGLAALRSGSLLLPAALHALNNLFSSAVAWLAAEWGAQAAARFAGSVCAAGALCIAVFFIARIDKAGQPLLSDDGEAEGWSIGSCAALPLLAAVVFAAYEMLLNMGVTLF